MGGASHDVGLVAESVEAKSYVKACAVAVIEQEAQALAILSKNLPSRFEDAVDAIAMTRGHLVIAGVGKSGHIGRKLAATFSATGTPSFFVHAAEAGHGDLGMIRPEDVLAILSNSGASPELRPLLAHAQAQQMTVIGIASREDSPLMRASTVPLVLPDIPEACPEGIAPTTSTTMMIALGDALAIAVMKVRGVTRNLLVSLHPSGSIGFGNMPVDSLLDKAGPPPILGQDSSLRDVVLEISSGRKGLAGVVADDGALIGVISDGDVRRSLDCFFTGRARDVMTRNPKTVSGDTPVAQVMRQMLDNKITAIFVMERKEPSRPLGVLDIHDLSRPA